MIIPTFSDPYYNQRTTIDGKEYGLQFRYNQREDRWYLTLLDDTGAIISAGVKLVCDFPLFTKTAYDERLPLGTFIVRSSSVDDSPPGLNDLVEGGRCQLLYLSREES